MLHDKPVYKRAVHIDALTDPFTLQREESLTKTSMHACITMNLLHQLLALC